MCALYTHLQLLFLLDTNHIRMPAMHLTIYKKKTVQQIQWEPNHVNTLYHIVFLKIEHFHFLIIHEIMLPLNVP